MTLYYQIMTREGKTFGSPILTGELLLKLVPERVRPIMQRLGYRITIVDILNWRLKNDNLDVDCSI